MPWNPDTYNQFKKERYQPFFDLISHIEERPGLRILDLGCGTGELTQVLAEKFTGSNVTGIDNSAEMLAQAPQYSGLSFQLRSIEEQLNDSSKWDLIVANASLQWVDDHPALINTIIDKLNTNGQLAIQMPSQTENILNRLLQQLVQEPLYTEALNGWMRPSPVLSLEAYTELFFRRAAGNMVIYQKVYPIIAQSHDALYEFISGSAMVPYMERLPAAMHSQFEADFRQRIAGYFTQLPAIYAFKRIILYARFNSQD
ncbi:MAG: methyltransferase domain-containing protein [Ferruginibacter sp.]